MPYREPTLKAPAGAKRRVGVAVVVGVAAAAATAVVLVPRRATRTVPAPVVPSSTSPVIQWGTPIWVADRPADRSQRFLAGGARFVVSSSGRIEVAPTRFEADIAVAAEVRDGWVFVTWHGDVARSDTFLGPLRSLGRVPDHVRFTGPDGVGRAAFVGSSGNLWTTAGDGPPVHAELPGPVREAVFSDERSGVALLRDLRVAVTTDGGLTWSVPSLAGEFARDVYLSSLGATVQTTGGRMVLGADGTLRHRPNAVSLGAWRHIDRGTILGRLNAAGSQIGAVYTSPPGATSIGEPREWPYESVAEASRTREGTYHCRYAGDGEPPTPSTWATLSSLAQRRGGGQDDGAGSTRAFVRAATPRGMLMTRSPGGAPVLAWMNAAGRVVPIPEPALDEADDGESVHHVLVLPDGGVALVVLSAYVHVNDFRDAGVALDVGPDGRVRGRRPFEWWRGESVVGVARRGACAGPVIHPSRSGAGRLLPIADDAHACERVDAIDLPPIDGASLRPCRRRPSADATVLVGFQGVVALQAEDEPLDGPDPTLFSPPARATLEGSGAGYCIRELAARGSPGDTPLRDITLTARGPALEGSVARDVVGQPAAWLRIRCEPGRIR